jgi:alkylation response protein AidB-like acyl-CoA dehydrogenase
MCPVAWASISIHFERGKSVPLELPDFNLSPERAEFRDTLRRYFEEHASIAEVRQVLEAGQGISDGLWKGASEDLGLAGIAIAEEHGGQGFGLTELALALGEVGRALAPIPLFASAGLAARVVQSVMEGEAGGEWLTPIAEGRAATLAWVEEDGNWDPGAVLMVAEGEGDTCRLSGSKHFVLDAGPAEQIFVIARNAGSAGDDGLGLYAVDAGAAGLSVEAQETLDLTRPLATLHFSSVEARLVGRAGADRLRAGLDEATALLVAEMVGGMGRVIETAVDYAAERHQFSRAIGSFQAIKHKCADLLIDYEAARTASYGAITAYEENDPERYVLVGVGKSFVGPAFVRMTVENMQIQGGVGYTWEYDAHLYYRRAMGSNAILGDAAQHQERLALGVARDLDSRAAEGRRQ